MATPSILYIIIGILLISCTSSTPDELKDNSAVVENQASELTTHAQTENALQFINGYVENCNKMKEGLDMLDWVKANSLTTASFKSELTHIIDQANESDPELGLDFDPIFDAQDYPEEGFIIESFDQATHYLVVKGKNWETFRLTIKVKEEQGKWLVEGCGIVNIPKEKQMKR